MRTLVFGIALAALASSLASAQQPQGQPAPAAFDPARNQLDAVLANWEKQMHGVNTLYAKLIRTTLNKTFNTTNIYEGYAKYMKPLPTDENKVSRALLELKKKDNPQDFEKYVFTEAFIYQYRPLEKVIHVHQTPVSKPGQPVEDNVMSFVFGMKAEEAKRRYELSIQKPEDPNYWYLVVQPRFPEDKQEFSMARLVLLKQNYLPRQFWYMPPNGNSVTFDIPVLEPNSRLVVATDFVKPNVPPGWKMENAPQPRPQGAAPVPPAGQPQPRVARPNQ